MAERLKTEVQVARGPRFEVNGKVELAIQGEHYDGIDLSRHNEINFEVDGKVKVFGHVEELLARPEVLICIDRVEGIQ